MGSSGFSIGKIESHTVLQSMDSPKPSRNHGDRSFRVSRRDFKNDELSVCNLCLYP